MGRSFVAVAAALMGLVGFAGAMNGAWADEPDVDCAEGDLIADAIADGDDIITFDGTVAQALTL